jgi:rifampicin phosphotransferase
VGAPGAGRQAARADVAPVDFAERAEAAEAAARRLVADVREARGPLRAAVLRTLLRRARALGGLRERPKFDLVRVVALARRVLRDAGADLVRAGALDDADDAFFLTPEQIRRGGDLRAAAASARAEYERELRRRRVPRVLTSTGEAFYDAGDVRAAGVVGAADDVRAEAAADGATLTGTAVSAGVAAGRVRVVEDPVSARLDPGDVLVARATDPGWTPLFLAAGALVTEVGGVMSHGSVVAREYGIPAVVGVQDATTRLRPGEPVRVDGSAGTVTRERPAPPDVLAAHPAERTAG